MTSTLPKKKLKLNSMWKVSPLVTGIACIRSRAYLIQNTILLTDPSYVELRENNTESWTCFPGRLLCGWANLHYLWLQSSSSFRVCSKLSPGMLVNMQISGPICKWIRTWRSEMGTLNLPFEHSLKVSQIIVLILFPLRNVFKQYLWLLYDDFKLPVWKQGDLWPKWASSLFLKIKFY